MRSFTFLLCYIIAAPALWAQSAVLEPLGDLPGGSVYGAATAVSADGSVVVGASSSANGLEAFRWEGGVMEGLGDLPGGPFSSVAQDVSADGSVVVGVSFTPDDRPEAFRWEDGVMVGLGNLPGASYSYATAVSADGSVIVDECGSGSDIVACRWVDGGPPESLGDLPGGNERSRARGVTDDGSVIVGSCLTEVGYVACRWVDGGPPESTAEATTFAQDIAPNGAVTVGQCSLVPEVPCRWVDGGATEDLGVLPGTTAYLGAATATTDDGTITLGWMFSASFEYYGLLWVDGGVAREAGEALEDVYGVDLGSWTDLITGGSIGSGVDVILGIGGVTGDGRVLVGGGTDPNGDLAAWRLVLPEGTLVEPALPAPVLALSVHPNPARGFSLLRLDVPEAGRVKVSVFDALGRRVAVLHDGPLAAGSHTLRFEASDLPSGVYAVRASTEAGTVAQRITLLR